VRSWGRKNSYIMIIIISLFSYKLPITCRSIGPQKETAANMLMRNNKNDIRGIRHLQRNSEGLGRSS
jgi:hypothetical protein